MNAIPIIGSGNEQRSLDILYGVQAALRSRHGLLIHKMLPAAIAVGYQPRMANMKAISDSMKWTQVARVPQITPLDVFERTPGQEIGWAILESVQKVLARVPALLIAKPDCIVLAYKEKISNMMPTLTGGQWTAIAQVERITPFDVVYREVKPLR